MTEGWSLPEAINAYRGQNDQNALVELLREVQAAGGGVITSAQLAELSDALSLKLSYLTAIIKRYPSLHTEDAPHTLQICGGERCRNRGCAELRRSIETRYHAKNGMSSSGRFSYTVTGCMRNCPNGPNVVWDGRLYSHMDAARIIRLIEDGDR